MEEIVKHINDTNASFRTVGAGDAKNTDLFLDNEHYELFSNAGTQITIRLSKENLQKAVLFIASILPRKYDNSSTHKIEQFSSDFVFEQLAILDAFFTINGVKVDSRTQIWNPRKDIMKKNGEIDNRFYFNGLIEDVVYKNHKGEQKVAKFTIRNYLAGGYSDLHIKKSDNGIFDVWVTNTFEYKDDGRERQYEENETTASDKSLQRIFYGAPGTGKSFEINRLTKNKEVIRTTFHPDSDYSTFVGAYKPTSIEVPVRDVTGKVIVENGQKVTENRIVYEFVEQAFLQAYTKAWYAYAKKADGEKAKEQYLVIEEINRGNCAQIFGDLFQLLDRNGYGFSEYPITADKDMKKQLSKAFKELTIADAERINGYYEKDVVGKVLSGEILMLPDNLYIWATMNTSDQSLFPIDSAFKRRWDWKYIPISEGVSDNGTRLGYKIRANGKLFDWWQFVEIINAEINEQTKSEDKKLGYFFCKANEGIINAEAFVSKVVFYLWNDVFKDQDVASIFNDGDEELTFSKFYDTDVRGKAFVKEDKVEVLLKNLGLEPLPATEEPSAEEMVKDDNTPMTVVLNGEVINEGTSSNTFIKVLQKIGLETFADKIVADNILVRKEGEENRVWRRVDNYFVYIGWWANYKKSWLQNMAKELEIDLKVE